MMVLDESSYRYVHYDSVMGIHRMHPSYNADSNGTYHAIIGAFYDWVSFPADFMGLE